MIFIIKCVGLLLMYVMAFIAGMASEARAPAVLLACTFMWFVGLVVFTVAETPIYG